LTKEYDLVIIGRGAAAFSAAIKASEITLNQASIAMIGFGPLGGTCVNVGCVPSKYLIEAAKVAYTQRNPKYPGIEPHDPAVDFHAIMESLREAVLEERESKYASVLRSYPNIELYDGWAHFISRDTVRVESGDESLDLKGYNFIIATGSRTRIPEIEGLGDTGYLTSDSVWGIDSIPPTLGIIGGGFVGLEIGQALHRLGTEVTIIKQHDTIVPGIEKELGDELLNALKAEGISFLTGRTVTRVYRKGGKKIIETVKNDEIDHIEVEEILISSGRIPNVDGLSLENAGIKYSGKGIAVSEDFSTTNPLIYAAGDVVDQKYRLETLAAREGATVASNIFSHADKSVSMQEIPWAVFTDPQLASVGNTEDEYRRIHGSVITRTIDLSAVPKARILREEYGRIKIVADPDSSKVVGVHALSPYAAEFIMEGVMAVKYGLTFNDIIENSHIFPTVSEGIKLAAQSFTRDLSMMSCCME
jgi:mercuric reductase